jgi:LmbE family N-acetylglucosaminyl deacetylase
VSADRPVLVLSPHPDDAILGCWSVLDQLARQVAVVNVFAGLPPAGTTGGWDRECGIPDSVEMMRRRRAEDEAALATAGVTPTHLNFLDRQYTDEERDITTIAAAVAELVPRCSAIYAPAATGGFTRLLGVPDAILGSHPDHEVVREVALRLREPSVVSYLYAEIPYATGDARGTSWPAAAEAYTPELEDSVGEPLEMIVKELPGQSLARRLAAVARYTTQMNRLQEGVGQFAGDPAILRYEVCWRLRSTGRD